MITMNNNRQVMVDRRDLDEAWDAMQEPGRKPLHELEAELDAADADSPEDYRHDGRADMVFWAVGWIAILVATAWLGSIAWRFFHPG
jgi:hypothetical protein